MKQCKFVEVVTDIAPKMWFFRSLLLENNTLKVFKKHFSLSRSMVIWLSLTFDLQKFLLSYHCVEILTYYKPLIRPKALFVGSTYSAHTQRG